MIGNQPSFGDYVRAGQGGPEGVCLTCGHQGPMERSLTGYECPLCHSPNLKLKLKDGRLFLQFTMQVQAKEN